MKTIDCIKERYSVREYKLKDVKIDLVNEILDIARFAPSSGNLQNWVVIIVTNRDKRIKIAKICADQTWMANAPVHLIICNDHNVVKREYGQRGLRYSIMNVSAFIQNILLLAHDEGLGACWVSAFSENSLRKVVEISENLTPESVITLGYPDEKPGKRKRFEVRDFVFFDKGGNKNFTPLPKTEKITENIKEKTNVVKNKFKDFLKNFKK